MRGVVTLFTCVNEIIFYVTLVDAGPVVGSDFFFLPNFKVFRTTFLDHNHVLSVQTASVMADVTLKRLIFLIATRKES